MDWRKRLERRAMGGIAAAGLAALAAPALAADAIDFAPHIAVYEIALDRATPGSGVAEMTGRMVYELTGSACEGYTQNMRFVTRTVKEDGSQEMNDLRTSSFEDSAAKRLRFSSSQFRDDEAGDATQGDAVRADDGIKVSLDKPKRRTLTLGTSVYFPIQHQIALVKAAHDGKGQFAGDLYDGSEKGDKVNPTNTIIGKRIGPGTMKSPAALKNGDKLDQLASWPMAISYFEPGTAQKDAVPSYELAFRFYDNGVTTRLHIDYGEFAIKGELKELTFLERTACPGDPAKPGAAPKP